MKAVMGKIRPARVLLFLLSPEDSSSAQTHVDPELEQSPWRRRKTLFWMAISILVTLAIGQL